MIILATEWKFSILGPDSEWFWVACQSVVVAATLILIYLQVRLQSSAHLVDSFAEFERRWNSPHMLQARKHVCQNYKPDNRDVDSMTNFLCSFFEELGVFCSRRVLDVEIAWEIYSFEIEHFWEIVRNPIIEFRTNQRDRTFFVHMEELYKQMVAVGRKKGCSGLARTANELQSFLRHELERVDFLLSASGEPSKEEYLRRLLAESGNANGLDLLKKAK